MCSKLGLFNPIIEKKESTEKFIQEFANLNPHKVSKSPTPEVDEMELALSPVNKYVKKNGPFSPKAKKLNPLSPGLPKSFKIDIKETPDSDEEGIDLKNLRSPIQRKSTLK